MPLGPALPETSLVLDTNILTAWRYQKPTILRSIRDYQSRLKLLPSLTAISVYEALYGFENKVAKFAAIDERTKEDLDATRLLISSCNVLAFDQRAAEIAAYMVPRLPKNIPKESLLDALIAAVALAHGHGVATRDRGFESIAVHTPPAMILRVTFWAI